MQINRCIYCEGRLYDLAKGMKKCARCTKKFSPQKVQRELRCIEAFCEDSSALALSDALGISYPTALTYYRRFRELIVQHLDDAYNDRTEEVKEFDEYIYLEASKRHERRNIFDAHNFLTFDYGGKVYTILLPSFARHKQQFLNDGLESLYYEEFSRFLRLHRIAKLEKRKNSITAFWEFFEDHILRYKGVKAENFVYYLKEAEFKFNYPKTVQQKILTRLWFQVRSLR